MKKVLIVTYFYHSVCFVAMFTGQLARVSRLVSTSWMADLAGTFVFPLALAAAAMVTSLRGGRRVIRQFPNSAAAIGIVGLLRAALFFFVQGKYGFLAAMKYLLISFLLLTLWFLIFEISSNMMNKSTKINRKYGGKNK